MALFFIGAMTLQGAGDVDALPTPPVAARERSRPPRHGSIRTHSVRQTGGEPPPAGSSQMVRLIASGGQMEPSTHVVQHSPGYAASSMPVPVLPAPEQTFCSRVPGGQSGSSGKVAATRPRLRRPDPGCGGDL
ncbi:hypothetical protein BE18_43640 [Sorangium cellulosum]|uniref:Uncharacterized protein n=1 Tax=Sorangium cellulosum TaxID=56 RepID=A0A150S9L4_SORCE|nr:hypothetical protein BE18_43640 [Sorangium cellulosum]